MRSYHVSGYFITEKVSVPDVFQKLNEYKILKREKGLLFYHLAENSFLYVKDYGAVVFFNVSDKHKDQIFNLINVKGIVGLSDFVESYVVNTGKDHQDFKFNEIDLTDLNSDVVHIICLNLAQSVALFYYRSLTDKLLANTFIHTKELQSIGKVSLGRKKLLKYIGETLNLKNNIAENLYVFNTPMVSWKNEMINSLDKKLNDELEIKIRYNGIKENLNIISENLDLFKDISLHKHSSTLEWIIILLILFEVLHVLYEKII